MIVPKSLGFDFDASVDGSPVSVAPRAVDSAIAALHLVQCANAGYGGALAAPGADVIALLEDICASFPDQAGTACRAVSRRGVKALFHPSLVREVAALDPDDLRWVARAAQVDLFVDEIEILSKNYILTYELPDVRDCRLLKMRTLENAQLSTDEEREREAFDEYAYERTTAKFFDMARASSTHLRVVAPEQMFVADPILRTADGDTMLGVIDQSSLDRLVFYVADSRSDAAVTEFYLMPATQDFITPAKYVSRLALLSMVGVFLVQVLCATRTSGILAKIGIVNHGSWWAAGEYDLVRHMADEAEAALALVMLLPSLLLGQLLVLSQNELRWRAMRAYRIPAVVSTTPLVLLSALTLAGFPFYRGFAAALIWLGCACVTLLCRWWWMSGFEANIASAHFRSRLFSRLRFTLSS